MNNERVYISAPVTGRELSERKAYFDYVSSRLLDKGYIPVNPLKNGVPSYACIARHLKADFAMLTTCDRIILCDGWEESDGCQKEATVARWSGISVLPYETIE